MVASLLTCAGLHAAALHTARGEARTLLQKRIIEYRGRLQALLGSQEPPAIEDALGTEAAFFDTGRLSASLRKRGHAETHLEAARKQRIESAIAVLKEWSERGIPAAIEADDFADAAVRCEEVLAEFTKILRAMRVARLEAESAYDAATHDRLLEGLSWHSAKKEELLAIPSIVVAERAERVRGAALDELGVLLRCGGPIQVVIRWDGVRLGETDLGWFAMSQREAFVLQSSMAEREHLDAGLLEMAGHVTPAVAIISQVESRVPQQARAFPLYRYNPKAGVGWVDRFDLWRANLDEGLTPAHAFFESQTADEHFEVVMDESWEQDQMELSDYLAHKGPEAPRAIPFIWVWTAKKERRRALVSREMVEFSRERIRNWEMLEEMAGVRNSRAEAMIARVRQEMEEAAGVRERHAREQAQHSSAASVIQRLVAVLTSTGVQAPVSNNPVGAMPRAEVALAEPPVSERQDPYIDSFLCTSCNDCVKINSRMFAYNVDKQAYIADSRTGTYAELVKAAEGCPAKCIHPGSPRPGDASATPAIVARAKKIA